MHAYRVHGGEVLPAHAHALHTPMAAFMHACMWANHNAPWVPTVWQLPPPHLSPYGLSPSARCPRKAATAPRPPRAHPAPSSAMSA